MPSVCFCRPSVPAASLTCLRACPRAKKGWLAQRRHPPFDAKRDGRSRKIAEKREKDKEKEG